MSDPSASPKTPDSEAPDFPERTDDKVVAPTGSMEVWIWRDGRLIEHTRDDNLVVTGAKFILAQLLGGNVAGNSITQIGFGSNPAAAAPGNTTLSDDAYIKPLDALPAYPAPNKVSFALSLGQLESNGLSLAEFGLITASGALFARRVRAAPITKDQGVSLSAIWTVIF